MTTHRGYTAEQAWAIAMGPAGAHSVVDLEGGGYAVPLERAKKIAPPSKTVPIRAQIPRGKVWILPSGSFGIWKVVSGKSRTSKRRRS